MNYEVKMNATELKGNFTSQLNSILEEIKDLETQISNKREIALKLKGAIEGLEILEQQSAAIQEPPSEPEEA